MKRFSSTVIWSNSWRPSGTCTSPRPNTWSGVSRASSWPSKMILPVLEITRDKARRVVVFPAPLLPTSATISLRAISKAISRSTVISPYPALNASTRSNGSLMAFFTEIGGDDLIIAEHFLRLAFSDFFATTQNQQPVRQALNCLHHVLDHQNANAPVANLFDDIDNFLDLDVIEPRHNFVKEEQLGSHRQRLGKLESL